MADRRPAGVSRRDSLKLAGATAALAGAPHLACAAPATTQVVTADARDQALDQGWRFQMGDGAGFADRGFDDARWRLLDLPHDWSIEDISSEAPAINAAVRDVDTAPLWQPAKSVPRRIGPFDAGLSAGGAATGFTVGGVAWYRKRFRLPALAADSRVEVVFDGVYMNAEVWLNGARLGARPYGYAPFAFDLTPHIDPAGDNVLAVRVANLGRNSRWYSGSGIYRHVKLNVTRSLRFGTWGVAVTTPALSKNAATVHVQAQVEGAAPDSVLIARVLDPSGRVTSEARLSAQAETQLELAISRPELWSPQTPRLHRLDCELRRGDEILDRISLPFGVRKVEVDAERGLRINGEPYKLRGGCIHHDNGLLGAAAFDRAEARKVELLKARGFNAIRTSHNPPSPALLDACDRLGMLVVEEAFDCWRRGKNQDDYSLYFDGWQQQDLAAMIRRDGNHPSVIIWSIGNEIPDVNKADAVSIARLLSEEVRRLDPTRPVTEAINGSTGPDVTGPDGKPASTATQFLDVAGYNYALGSYERDHARFPARVMMGTESFPKEVDAIWRLTERSPYLIGDFVWAAMDFLGEAGAGQTVLTPQRFVYGTAEYPWFNAFEGDLDLIGEQKPPSLLRDVVWGVSPLELSVQRPLPEGHVEQPSPWGWRDELQSWTWPGAEGKPLNVQLYTRADRVELDLNGQKVGEKALTDADRSVASFSVPYASGRLTATAYRGGRRIGRRVLETAGPAAALRMRPDAPRVTASRNDLAFATIEVVDAQGRLLPDAVEVLELGLSGPVELAAFGNANPRGVASFRQPVAKTWHGRALAILRPTGAPGEAVAEVRSKGLRSATAKVHIT